MEKIMKCPICERSFNLRKFVLAHLARRHPAHDQQTARPSAPPVDRLPGPIRTRKRGSTSMALVLVEPPPKKFIHDFDLNKLPPLEEEEEDGGQFLALPWHDDINDCN
ncbi:hypothetical protein CASFOL_002978 [Castilleja foliolosa]|uniref:C2H2-type domain-containing protein n=1 Tax=Castilleja foliolosa TaxID=1961234 RepID=A0ABD3EFW8_9LAMI